MGSFSIWHWLVVLIIVLLLFGTSKLRNMGGDLGAAIKNFKKSVKEGEDEAKDTAAQARIDKGEGKVVEGEATREKDRS